MLPDSGSDAAGAEDVLREAQGAAAGHSGLLFAQPEGPAAAAAHEELKGQNLVWLVSDLRSFFFRRLVRSLYPDRVMF